MVTANGNGVEDGVTAATSTTAADVAKAVVNAVPEASLTDINSLNVTDIMVVLSSAVGAIIGTAGIASSSGTNMVADNITGIEGGITNVNTNITTDVANAVRTAVPDALVHSNFFSTILMKLLFLVLVAMMLFLRHPKKVLQIIIVRSQMNGMSIAYLLLRLLSVQNILISITMNLLLCLP